ncbi:MAG TPA: RDD family protein [Allocoleopsis sp.]
MFLKNSPINPRALPNSMRFFNRVILQTPESVELEFTLAGIGNRAYALLIDYIVLGFILLVFFLIWLLLSTQLTELAENLIGNSNRLWLWLIAIELLIGFFIYVGYFVFFEALWQGQTPGKRYVKIRVIRDDGRPISLQQSTLRALLRPIDDIFFLGVFLIALGKREKRLGDWVAGTLVVQEERPVSSANFVLSEESKTLAKQLQGEADLSRLLPEDFAVIREYLQRSPTMISQARSELSRQLAHQIKDIIALEKVPEKTTAHRFLEAVYLAYQQQSSSSE